MSFEYFTCSFIHTPSCRQLGVKCHAQITRKPQASNCKIPALPLSHRNDLKRLKQNSSSAEWKLAVTSANLFPVCPNSCGATAGIHWRLGWVCENGQQSGQQTPPLLLAADARRLPSSKVKPVEHTEILFTRIKVKIVWWWINSPKIWQNQTVKITVTIHLISD